MLIASIIGLSIAWCVFLILSKGKRVPILISGALALLLGLLLRNPAPNKVAPSPQLTENQVEAEATKEPEVEPKSPSLTLTEEDAKGVEEEPKEERPNLIGESQPHNLKWDLSGEWTQLDDPKVLGYAIDLGFKNKRSKLTLSISHQVLGKAFTSAEVIAKSAENFAKSLPDHEVFRLSSQTINGIKYEVVASKKDTFFGPNRLINFSHGTGGVAYQFAFSFDNRKPIETLLPLAAQTLSQISLIDPELIMESDKPTVVAKKLPKLGIEMTMDSKEWVQQKSFPFWQASYSHRLTVQLFSYDLSGIDTDTDLLFRGQYRRTRGQEPAGETMRSRKELKVGGYTFIEYRVPLEGQLTEYHRFLIQGERAWLFLIITKSDNDTELAASLALATELQSRFKILEDSDEYQGSLAPAILALQINQMGIILENDEKHLKAAALFQRAAELDPDDPAYFDNLIFSLGNAERLQRLVLTYEEREKEKSKSSHLSAGYSYCQLSKPDQALACYKRAFQRGKYVPDELTGAARSFVETSAYQQCAALLDYALEDGASTQLRLWHTLALVNSGRSADALKFLEKIRDTDPKDTTAIHHMADAYVNLDQTGKAKALIDEAIELIPDDAELWQYRGYLFYEEGDFAAALTEFEKAGKLAPNNESIRADIANTRARVGLTAHKETSDPIEAVPLPKDALRAEVKFENNGKSDVFYEMVAVMFHYQSDKPLRKTTYRELTINDAQALERYNTLTYSYSPLHEKIHVNYCEVISKDGKVLAKADRGAIYLTDSSSSMANDDKVLNLPVSGLEVGCTIRSAVTIEDRAVSEDFDFERFFFVISKPFKRYLVGISGDIDKVEHSAINGLSTKKQDKMIWWVSEAQQAHRFESYQPYVETFRPTLYLGAKGVDWAQVTEEYHDKIAERLKSGDELQSAVKLISAAAKSDAEKIQLAFRWVQDNFTYKAIEFGDRAIIPNPSAKTCKDRYGDCKDLSVLLVGLLKQLDIDAYPCLVATNDLVSSEIPSLDQFNHMIVYLPKNQGRPALWMDPTMDQKAKPLEIPLSYMGSKTLIVNPDLDAPLVEVPVTSYPDETKILIERHLKVDPETKNGGLITETLTFKGVGADYMRGYLSSIPPQSRDSQLHSYLLKLEPNFTVTENRITHLEDQSKPLIVALKGKLAKAYSAGSKLTTIPNHWVESYLYVQPVQKRENPFEVTTPWEIELKFTAEDHSTVEEQLDSEKTKWGQWNWKTSHADKQRSFYFKGNLPRSEGNKDEFKEFRQFWNSAIDFTP